MFFDIYNITNQVQKDLFDRQVSFCVVTESIQLGIFRGELNFLLWTYMCSLDYSSFSFSSPDSRQLELQILKIIVLQNVGFGKHVVIWKDTFSKHLIEDNSYLRIK